jgi:single-stranded DNA-binding protein
MRDGDAKNEGRNRRMLDKVIENNRVTIIGEVVSDFTYSHEVFGEGFYMVDIAVNRLSNSVDIIPLMVSERLVDVTEDYRGMIIEATGQFRSYNRHEENHNRLVLSIFAREFAVAEETQEATNTNQIFLDGYICKPPVYRKTPLGREIADILIAVNRPYGKSDYIPALLGDVTQDMQRASRLVNTSVYGDAFRAESIPRSLMRIPRLREQLTRFR